MHAEKTFSAEDNRALKARLVAEGQAHAALVFDGDVAVAWCQYGTPEELPNIKHRKDYETGLVTLARLPNHVLLRGQAIPGKGVASLALRGAVDLIGQAGGGVVEAYPQDTGGKKITASFLYGCTRSLFEQAGFSYDRPKGKNHCVMRTTVSGSSS